MAKRRTRRAQAAQAAEVQRLRAVEHDIRAAEIFSGLNVAPTFPDGIPAVSGGFRTGKRKRGTSLLKAAPITTTRVTARYSTFADGIPVSADQRTLRYTSDNVLTFADALASSSTTRTHEPLPVPTVARISDTDPQVARLIATCDRIIREHHARENLAQRARLNIAQEVRASVKNGTARDVAIARAISARMPQRPIGAYLP